MVITDKLNSYKGTVAKEFPDSIHIRAGIRDAINNNKLERFHGTWRERDKVMRGLCRDETAGQMLENYRTYYNFVRPHMAMGNKTPSEIAGLDICSNENKWIGLIEKSMEVIQ